MLRRKRGKGSPGSNHQGQQGRTLAEISIEQPTTLDLPIALKAAEALGVAMPIDLIASSNDRALTGIASLRIIVR
jgi:hypothetical protein